MKAMKAVRGTHAFPIIIERDEGGFFVATNPALPGCYSQGRTMDEALQNVREATEVCLAGRQDNDRDIAASSVSVHVISV